MALTRAEQDRIQGVLVRAEAARDNKDIMVTGISFYQEGGYHYEMRGQNPDVVPVPRHEWVELVLAFRKCFESAVQGSAENISTMPSVVELQAGVKRMEK